MTLALAPGRRFTRTAIAALAGLCAPMANAATLQLIDTFDENDFAGGVDNTYEAMFVDDGSLVVHADLPIENGTRSRVLLIFARDPDTGLLSLADRIDDAGERGTLGYLEIGNGGIASAGNTLWVSGRASPDTCAAPCNPDRSILAYTLGTDGRASFAYSIDTSRATGKLVASPDGRHLYALGGQSFSSFRVQDIGNLVEIDGQQGYIAGSERLRAYNEDIAFTPDGRFAFVSVDNDPVPGGITTFSRDVDTGLLSGVETLVSAAGRPIGVTSHLAVSPDGETLYATGWNNGVDTDFGPGGVLSFDIGDDGTLDYRGVDTSAEDTVPGAGGRPMSIVLAADGRQLFVHDNARYLHKYTVGADGGLTYRGFATNEEDGVPNRLIDITRRRGETSLLMPSDSGSLYYRDRLGVLATFDNRADLAAGIAGGSTASADGTSVTSRVELYNAGPVDAHGIVVDITSSSPILGTSLPELCTVSGTSASCTFDRLVSAVGTEFTVDSELGADGTATLEVVATGIELDPDDVDNRGTAIIRRGADGGGIDTAVEGSVVPTPVPVGTGGGASAGESASDGGGCSIAGTGDRDPLFALLLGLGLTGLLRRRRSR